ncbi:hypothetical protein KJ708_03880 [bacterium]|nr:hypothetical protein [bacterium]
MMLLQRKIFYLIIVTLFIQFNFVSCSGDFCERYYWGDVQFEVVEIVFSEYDQNSSLLLNESVLTNYELVQTGEIDTTTLDYLNDAELEIVAYTADSRKLKIELIINDKFESLELNQTVEDGLADYLFLRSFRMEGDPEGTSYESTGPLTISRESDGYHLSYGVKPYVTNEDEDREYENTREFEIVFKNIMIVEESLESQVFCRN